MPAINAFAIYALDLPFKKPFKHAAADRSSSNSLMLKCITDSGHIGFGESLPREYVTGETREESFLQLRDHILPRLIGREFQSLNELTAFLKECDGKAPGEWLAPDTPQTAAWAAVDLALLDAFGNALSQPIRLSDRPLADNLRYSAVFSADRGWKALKSLLLYRLYGFRAIKLKVESTTEAAIHTAKLCRRIMGDGCDIRVDANMAWDQETAIATMQRLSAYGVRSFEQPLRADDLAGLARLIRETGLEVMADESVNDDASLERLIQTRSCSSVNIRISKCGGLIGAMNRCEKALAAGLKVQVGCQVGETSLLSAAQLVLIAAVQQVTYSEGCFGLHLLRTDPVQPLKQFGYGGRPPSFPEGPGFGVKVDEQILSRYCSDHANIG
jgi:muconate cycloisomerase